MLPVRPTPAPTAPRRGGRLFILWLMGGLVIIGAETGRRMLRGTPIPTGFLTLVACVLTQVFGSSHGSQDDAFRRGKSMGYDQGYLEGRRAARPVVVPMPLASRDTETLTSDVDPDTEVPDGDVETMDGETLDQEKPPLVRVVRCS